MIEITINGKAVRTDAEATMPLLWLLRDELRLHGTKYGCGIGVCGACTVLLDAKPANACRTTLQSASGRQVTTIEGLAPDGRLHAVQQAWLDAQVPQCGYCQPGIIMQVVGLLAAHPEPTDTHIDEAVTNICRCGTYPRVRPAILAAIRNEAASRVSPTKR
jgi:isoquinoline 1-oxidoreductase subunit alpha